MSSSPDRRGWLKAAGAAATALWLAGCRKASPQQSMHGVLQSAEKLTYRVQRAVMDRNALAREFTHADLSSDFRANGTVNPQDADYKADAAAGFSDWRIEVGGLVEQPLSLTLADLRAQPSRTQITRHDCVEGWSSIAEWTGARLGPLLDKAGLKPAARFIVFHCADSMGKLEDKVRYYESIDLVDAFHPQTILAYDMNGGPLPIRNGAPVRLRVERQLGYKHAKYVRRIEAVADLASVGRGQGGFWEDVANYEWYAGI